LPGRSKDIGGNQQRHWWKPEVDANNYSEYMAFCLLLAMWKRNTKNIFSVLFPQQLDDCGLISGHGEDWD